jgi:hypothetical protein
MLAPTAAFAAGHSSAAMHHAPAGNAQEGVDPDTTVTFAVTSGALTMTAPTAADLGSGAPGSEIVGQIGSVSVQDNRALLEASWTVTASSSAYTTGTALSDETIPASDVDYALGAITKSGNITTTGFGITMSNSPQTVVTGSSGVGNNSASWDPTITVHVPDAAVNGTYAGIIAHSVS